MYRKIYMVEAYDRNGECNARRYSRTFKTARKIQDELLEKNYKFVIFRKLLDYESAFVDPDWVEG